MTNHRPKRPGAEWSWKDGYPPADQLQAWQDLYAKASTTEERVELMARYLKLKR